MDLNVEQTHIIKDNKTILQNNSKRKCEDDDDKQVQIPNKKIQIEQKPAFELHITNEQNVPTTKEVNVETNTDDPTTTAAAETIAKSSCPEKKKLKIEVPQSPKKRLELSNKCDKQNKNDKQRFIYGNYSQYYGYRNSNNNNGKDQGFHDIRLDVLREYKKIFSNKQVLDIGCNTGLLTLEIAKQFEVKSMVGLDIDKQLINQAVKSLIKHKKSLPMDNELKRLLKFPFNVSFVHGNYVLRDQVLLEIERPQFDVILCLSITKWIQLNFGDEGLKLAFRRIFLQLRPKGILILEAQPYDNYGRRKKMTDTIFQNYKNIEFFPKDFDAYLLSPEVGFSKMDLMGVPDHCKKGFKRPIQIFYKD